VFTFLVAIVFKGVVLEAVLGKEQSGTGSGTRKHRWRNGTLRRLWGISSRAGGEMAGRLQRGGRAARTYLQGPGQAPRHVVW